MINIKRTPALLGILSGIVAIGAFACSSSDTTNINGVKDGGPTSDSPTTGKDGEVILPGDDAGPGEDGGPGADTGPTTSPKGGTVSIAQTFASASFHDTAGTAATNCTTEVIGGCHVSTCDLTVDAGTPVAVVGPNAGAITISGGALGLKAPGITLDLDDAGAYTGKPIMGGGFAAGDSLEAKAAGGTVPAFTGSVKGPPDLTIAPSLSFMTPITIKKDADFTFNWTPATGEGDVAIIVGTSEAGTKSVSVVCTAKVADGKSVVPTAALAKLQTTSTMAPVVQGIAILGVSNTAEVKAGDYTVSITASGTGGFGTFATQ